MPADLFGVMTPLGFSVGCTRAYWEFITEKKHPSLAGRQEDVIETLRNPDHVRASRKDSDVLLFYRRQARRWICAVVRRNEAGGFLITAYPTDAIKAGDQLWTRSK